MKAMVRELLGGSQPRAMRVVAYGNSRLPTYRSICFCRKMALTNKQQKTGSNSILTYTHTLAIYMHAKQ